MHENRYFILRSFSSFFRHNPVKLIVIFLITLFLGLNQGISIVLLIPLLGLLDPTGATGQSNKWVCMLNTFLKEHDITLNLPLILFVFAVSLGLMALLHYLQSTMQSAYQQEFSYNTRKRLFRKIIQSDWKFLNSKSKHNHIQILTTEIPKMTNYYYFYLGLSTKVISIIAHVTMALLISVKFTLFIVVAGFIVFFLLRGYLKKSSLIGGANIQVFRKMLKNIDDFWITVKMAKVHNTEEFYNKKFDDASTQMLDYQNKQIKNRALPQLLFTLAGVVTLIFVVYFAYNTAHIPLASLFVLILLFGRIFPQFMGINNDINMLVSNSESVRLVLDLDKEIEDKAFDEKKNFRYLELKDQIEIEGISFGYDTCSPLFSNFSEVIPANKITGIIGKSGCGKTTLIDIISGLGKPESGFVSVDGVALNEENLPSWRNGLGYLPQDAFFIDGSLRDNLIWDSGREIADDQLYEILRTVNADTLVRTLPQGLDTIIANYQFHFSGGERQRLALARVLLREPKLLILDEATSSLDPANERQIMECLVSLKESVTIIFVTHRINLIKYFDKVIELSNYQEIYL
jgi:ATP-binding cassette subfamily C protein